MTEDLMTTGDIAALLGVDRTLVHQWAKAGRLPIAATTGTGIRLFRRADVERLREERAS